MLRWLLLLVLLVGAWGCTEDEVETVEFRQAYILSRVVIDPISEFGYLVDRTDISELQEVWEPLIMYLGGISCEGPQDPDPNSPYPHIPAVIVIEGTRRGDRAEGRVGIFFGTSVDGDYRCDGTDVIQRFPMFIDDDGWSLLQGPLFVEGQTADTRVDLRPLSSQLESFLQGWVQVIGELHRGRFELKQGRLISTWSPDFLHRNPDLYNSEISQLDSLTAFGGLQPDFDIDADGLERFEYEVDEEDGLPRIVRCIDGDGTVFEGYDCPYRTEIVDSIGFILLFRTQPIEFIE